MKGKDGKDAGRAVFRAGAAGIHTQLTGQGRVDVPRLPGGMGPVRRAVGTAFFPALQFGQFAADLHGQDGDAPQALPQVGYPVRALTQHMVHDDPCPGVRGLGRGRVQDGGQGQARSRSSMDRMML